MRRKGNIWIPKCDLVGKLEGGNVMAFAERFEDLEIWREARRLNAEIHLRLVDCKDFDFRSQIRRAALSVMNNIAEGFERKTAKDFAHFLTMSKASSGEIRSMTYAGQDIGIFHKETAISLRESYETLSKRISAFQRSLH